MTADVESAKGGSEPDGLTLAVVRGPDSGLSARFHQDRVVVGRKKGDLVVGDRETSSTHASVEKAPGGRFLLKDLGSTNGTFLDGRRVTVVELASGQQFRCGANTLLFCVGEAELDADATVGPPDMAPEPPAVQDGRTTDVSPMGRLGQDPAAAARHASTATGEMAAGTEASRLDARTEVAPASAAMPVDAVLIPPMGTAAPRTTQDEVVEPSGPADRPLPSSVDRSQIGAYLLALEGRDKGSVFSLHHPEAMIGRADTHVRLTDPDVSRRHARLELDGKGGGTLRDLASTNGTLVNGTACLEGRVIDGDRIRVGDTVLELVLSDARLSGRLAQLEH